VRQDRDGRWWYESLSGAAMPRWLAAALTTPAPGTFCRIDWDDADRDTHRSGVLSCLEAIAAGEVYQACVCTQFTGTVAIAHLLIGHRQFDLGGHFGVVGHLGTSRLWRRAGRDRRRTPSSPR